MGRPLAQQTQSLSPEAAAWMGAIIEGEGTIGMYRSRPTRQRKHPHVVVSNTEVETIATCLRLVGAGNVGLVTSKNYLAKWPHHNLVWQWRLSATRNIAAFLPQVIPYLTGKRDAAEIVLSEIRQRIAIVDWRRKEKK